MTCNARVAETKGSEANDLVANDPMASDPMASDPMARGPTVVTSQSLFAGRREIIIEHGAERYRLCITASKKLILTK